MYLLTYLHNGMLETEGGYFASYKLAGVAHALLGVPATNNSSERSFSLAGRTLEQRQTMISSDSVIPTRNVKLTVLARIAYSTSNSAECII